MSAEIRTERARANGLDFHVNTCREDDPVLIPSTTDGASDSVKDLTLRFLPGVGHWVQQEATEEVNEMLSAWLAGKPVPGSETVSPGYAGE
ncbi:MAG: hypothetical protein OSB67_10740 [Alphaproteobacteria bacterium]|nr:hypothetical protein [Alphaproteobacteria bacterium]